jgi:TonB-linked SusC/RagA family outer membrane protein
MQVIAIRKATGMPGKQPKRTSLLTKHRLAVRIMKITAMILLAGCLQLSARGISQTLTLSFKEATLQKVFREIERQSGYTFFVNSRWFQLAKPVTIQVKDLPLTQVLDLCFKNQPFTYSISGKTIAISPKKNENNKTTGMNEAPLPANIDVSGKVMDESGGPLAGANVVEKGKQNGTTTNNDGVFLLKGVDENGSLEISFVGYQTLTIPINKRTSIAVSIKQSETNLQEVVINKGYYTEYKKFSTGNVSTIKAADIEKQPVQNPLLALQGRVTGIQITQLTGLPGGNTTVQIQGRNSLNAGLNPLIVVDGVPYPSVLSDGIGRDQLVQGGSPLNYINVNDIESIDVLKDADATSIYGSRAANGAILITTKKGKAGKTKLSVNIQQGWGKVTRHIDMMNTRQYLDMRYEAFKNDNLIPSNDPNAYPNYAPDLTLWDTTRYTNWQKVLIGGTAKYTNVNASISGGSNAIQYLIGANYRRQTTVFPGNFDDRVGGLHFNINSSSSDKKLLVQLSGTYMYDNNHLPGVDLTQRAIQLEPDAPVLFNPDGSLNWEPDASGNSTLDNPLASVYGSDYNKTTKNLVANLNLSYTILPGWTVGSSLGYTNIQSYNYSARRLEAGLPEYRIYNSRGSAFLNSNQGNWILEPQMKYGRILGSGKIEGLVGASIQKNTGDWLDISASGYANDQLMASPVAAPIKTLSGTSFMYKYNAVFGRLNYNWKEKYILNLTGRRDGSSRFGDNNKFHNFGSIGAAWIFTKEKLMERNIPFLSFGKLRGSFGTTGNDQIQDYLFISTYGTVNPIIPYQGGTGLAVTSIPNPNLQWEETKKLQIGLDLGVVNERILLGASYSRNQSSNQLITYVVPSITGFTYIQENFPATIRNVSWEFTLHTNNFKRRDFSWSTDFNLTIPQNKLVKFPGIEQTSYADGTHGVIVGQPVGIIKTYQYGGVDPATGLYYPLDRNGQPVYNPNRPNNPLDKTAMISTLPRFYGGLINAFSYKNFQLEFVLQFVRQMGRDDFNFWNSAISPGAFGFGSSNQPAGIVNKRRWQKLGDDAVLSKYSNFQTNIWPSQTNLAYSYNASFIRLKNVSLSWQAPTSWPKKLGLQSVSIYFRGENLVTITKYKSLDPETGSNSTLPPLQIWTIGAKLDF